MNKNIMSLINYKGNKFYYQISYLLSTKKKIGLYGIGIYSKHLEKRLNKWGVFVDYYAIDDEYYDSKRDYGKNVVPLHDISRYRDSILIIGFETIVEREEFLKEKISSVYKIEPQVEVIDFEHCYIDWDFIDYPYVLNHGDVLQKTYELLKDDFSRKVMVEYLNACISGESKDLCVLKTDHEHDYEYSLVFKNVVSGAVLECGAYTGKTAVELSHYLDKINYSGKIISLEPDETNFETLRKKTSDTERVIPLKYGVSKDNGRLYFDTLGGQGSKIVYPKAGEENKFDSIDVITLDTLAEKYGKIGAVLMDVEGSELDALKGGIETIKKYKPALGIRVYHLKDDIFTIPMYIAKEFEECHYDIYFRINANSRGILDMTLYAI